MDDWRSSTFWSTAQDGTGEPEVSTSLLEKLKGLFGKRRKEVREQKQQQGDNLLSMEAYI
jgi:hypothetical protein